MATPALTVVELSDDEYRLISSALHTYLNAFGHNEADMVRAVRELLAKLESSHAAPAAAAT